MRCFVDPQGTTSDKSAARKQTARTPRPPSQGAARGDGTVLSTADSLDVPDTASTQRTRPRVAENDEKPKTKKKQQKSASAATIRQIAREREKPSKNHKSEPTPTETAKKQKKKKKDEEPGKARLESPQRNAVSAPEVAETVRSILRTPGADADGSDGGPITPTNAKKKAGKKAVAKKGQQKKPTKKQNSTAPTAVMPDPNATPILEDDAEVHRRSR